MIPAIIARTRDVSPDQPQGSPKLRVLPILGSSQAEPGYRVLEAQVLPAVKVTEVSEGGSVPQLRVENALEERVFLMDGQELVGAKQNRILNTDVLVPARTTLTIPVSCVEAGRWRYLSNQFSPGKSASHMIRSGKQARVHRSLKSSGSHDANQSAVWNEVSMSMLCSSTSSSTSSLHDAYAQRQKEMDDFRQTLRLPAEAVGLAVFRGQRFLGLDIFDRHSTLAFFWQNLVESYAIDWLLVEPAEGEQGAAQPAAVTAALQRAAAGKWEQFASPGEGADHRLNDEELTGSALVWDDRVVVHLQLFPRAAMA